MKLSGFARKRRPANYEEQTHQSPWRVVRYAHDRRYAAAVDILAEAAGGVVVDYGGGDGEVVIRLLEAAPVPPAKIVILEPDASMRERAQERLDTHPLGGRVVLEPTLEGVSSALGSESADFIACLGVLEHLTLDERERFYRFAEEHLAPGGACVIDVPIEIGFSLLIKQVGRRALKSRGREYGAGELTARVLGRRVRDQERFQPGVETPYILSHRGFDHRLLMEEMRQRFAIQDVRNTPLRGLPAWLCNQEVVFKAQRVEAETSAAPRR